MPLILSANRIRITDTNGLTRFDTNDDFFHVTNAINSSRAFPIRQVQATFNDSEDIINQTNTYNLGSINASANFIAGSIKLDYSGSSGDVSGLTENAWFTITGGGSYVHVIDHFNEAKPSINYGSVPSFMITYTFTCNGSGSGRHVLLTERVYMRINDNQPNPGDTTTYTVRPFTMAYRLRVGLFT